MGNYHPYLGGTNGSLICTTKHGQNAEIIYRLFYFLGTLLDRIKKICDSLWIIEGRYIRRKKLMSSGPMGETVICSQAHNVGLSKVCATSGAT